jgi:hypothetical protein
MAATTQEMSKNEIARPDPFPALRGEGFLGSWRLPAFDAGY